MFSKRARSRAKSCGVGAGGGAVRWEAQGASDRGGDKYSERKGHLRGRFVIQSPACARRISVNRGIRLGRVLHKLDDGPVIQDPARCLDDAVRRNVGIEFRRVRAQKPSFTGHEAQADLRQDHDSH